MTVPNIQTTVSQNGTRDAAIETVQIPSKLSFEAIRAELGKLRIYINRDARRYYERITDDYDRRHNAARQEEISVLKRRGPFGLFGGLSDDFTGANCLVQVCNITVSALGIFNPVRVAGLPLKDTYEGISKILSIASSCLDTAKRSYDTHISADQTQARHSADHTKFLLERATNQASTAQRAINEGFQEDSQIVQRIQQLIARICQMGR